MTKKEQTVFGILTESVGLYFSNFGQFIKYMTFPVLGQVFGLVLVLLLTFWYTQSIPALTEKYKIFEDVNILILSAVLLTIPGIIIFTKAFWEYLVAYGAVNSMLKNMLKSGKVYDFAAHTELIKRRLFPYVGLWLLFGIFTLLALSPLLWVPAGVCVVYFVLIFQVFTFEPELSPIGCVKKSFNLVKGHFFSTFILINCIGILTYVIIPQLFGVLCEKIHITGFISSLTLPLLEKLPLAELNSFLVQFYLPVLKSTDIAEFITAVTITQIIIQYTLPMRSILWGLWYEKLNGEIPQTEVKKKKSKRPSEKLMEKTHKKYSTKRVDKNILKRAMEKDEEE